MRALQGGVLIVIVLLAMTTGAAAAVKYGTLNVTTIPSFPPFSANSFLNGSPQNATPFSETLPVGYYALKLTSPGYKDYNKVVRVRNNVTTTVIALMKLLPPPPVLKLGNLNVSSSPGQAAIFLNGTDTGKITPATSGVERQIANLAVGTYEVKLTKPGYLDYIAIIKITNNTTKHVNAVLQVYNGPYTGTLNVSSIPSGATLFLNNSNKGPTPQSISGLPNGTYQLNLTLPGYYEFNQTVDVTSGNTTTVIALMQALPPPPTLKFGNISVDSLPHGAHVFLNNSSQGTTPQFIGNLPIGDYNVRLTKAGYLDYNQIVTVVDGQTYPLYIFLQPIPPGNLVINSTPNGATIYIINPDGMGSYPGFTNTTLYNIKPGLYWVQLQQYGHGVNYTNVMVNPGETAVVDLILPKLLPNFPGV
jgi:hypothetical protein